jgi:hypothetical protein
VPLLFLCLCSRLSHDARAHVFPCVDTRKSVLWGPHARAAGFRSVCAALIDVPGMVVRQRLRGRSHEGCCLQMDTTGQADDPHAAARVVGALGDGSWDAGRDKERGGSGWEPERGGGAAGTSTGAVGMGRSGCDNPGEEGEEDSILDLDLGGIVGTVLDFGKVTANGNHVLRAIHLINRTHSTLDIRLSSDRDDINFQLDNCNMGNMYVCMYACMHVCVYVCMYVCIYVSMCFCMYVCVYI